MSRLSLRPGFRRWAVFGLCVAAYAAPGCGRKQQQQPVRLLPVVGKVTVDDRPLVVAEGSVVFWPDPAKGNPSKQPATGAISSKGDYTLYTELEKGAAPGWYKVV